MAIAPTHAARPPHAGPLLLQPRHPWRFVAGAAVLVVIATFLWSVGVNRNMRWEVVGEFLFDPLILNGLKNTIVLTVLCMGIGILLGIVIAVMAMSENPVLRATAQGYIWFFRGVPLLVQLIFWFNLALLFPRIGLSLPFLGIEFLISTNVLISSFTASVLGLGLHQAAYMAEIVRAGLLSVDKGQTEAARSIGMTDALLLRRIVLPQAFRIIVPPTGNELISLLKSTSLVAFIAGGEMLTVVQNIYSHNFLVIPLLLVATIWYLVITTVATIGQHFLERYVSQGFSPARRKRKRAADGEAGSLA